MASEKTIYGRIDCPVCGTHEGVRITKDKNGNPFGFCDADCDTQIRIGGSAYRVKKFYEKYPVIAQAMGEKPVTVTEPKEEPKTAAPIEATSKNNHFSLDKL